MTDSNETPVPGPSWTPNERELRHSIVMGLLHCPDFRHYGPSELVNVAKRLCDFIERGE